MDASGVGYAEQFGSADGGAGASSDDAQNSNLIVNYIPNNLTEMDMRNLFTPYGTIAHCKLVLDKMTGASAGYGFVKYTTDEAALKSLSALNGFQLNGKTLKVSIARPMHQKNEKTTLYVAGIPLSWTKNEFELMFRQYGNVLESKILTDAVGASRGVGFITFDSSQSANAALSLNNTQPPGFEKPVQVKIKLPHAANAQMTPQMQMMQMAGKMGNPQMANMMFGMGSPAMMGMAGGLAKPQQASYGKVMPQRVAAGKMASPYQRPDMAMAGGYGAPAMNPFGAPVDPYGLGGLGGAAAFGYGMDGMNPYGAAAAQGMAGFPGAAPQAVTGQGQLPGVCLFVYHIPNTASEEQLVALFSPYGMVTGVKIMRDMGTQASKGFGFVNFATLEQANMAMQALQNYAWEGKRLRISFKTSK